MSVSSGHPPVAVTSPCSSPVIMSWAARLWTEAILPHRRDCPRALHFSVADLYFSHRLEMPGKKNEYALSVAGKQKRRDECR